MKLAVSCNEASSPTGSLPSAVLVLQSSLPGGPFDQKKGVSGLVSSYQSLLASSTPVELVTAAANWMHQLLVSTSSMVQRTSMVLQFGIVGSLRSISF